MSIRVKSNYGIKITSVTGVNRFGNKPIWLSGTNVSNGAEAGPPTEVSLAVPDVQRALGIRRVWAVAVEALVSPVSS